MNYYNSLVSSCGFIHSIDMVYIEYFSKVSVKILLDEIRALHLRYKDIFYEEYLEQPYSSKYNYYHDMIVMDGVTVYLGRYKDYDRDNKIFRLLDMFQLRVNPNKHFFNDWFQELLKILLKYSGGGYLRKYDYAIDIPLSPDKVKVFYTRKEKGLYRGTRYLGRAGKHGYCKIYDKQKELLKQGEEIEPLTRVEYTFLGGCIPSFDGIYYMSDGALCDDFSGLNDTDIAIITMYRELKMLGSDYELKLGRKMMAKLKGYLDGSYAPVEYGDYLDRLLENIRTVFDCSEEPLREDEFFSADGVELPFD